MQEKWQIFEKEACLRNWVDMNIYNGAMAPYLLTDHMSSIDLQTKTIACCP